MKWVEVTVNTTRQAADSVADVFFSMGCQGVSVDDKNDVKDALKSGIYWDYVDGELLKPPSDDVKVSSFFLEEEYAERVGGLLERLADIRQGFEGCGSLELSLKTVDDEDWANNWKKFYKPVVVGGIKIVPEWLDDKDDANFVVVRLDPGMAFGTGEHETTKMCLSLIQSLPIRGRRVYDIGCGSGILGIAAALLGADVHMSDIDPTSVLTAAENAKKNGVTNKVLISRADLISGGKGSFAALQGAKLVVANITADILKRLAPSVGGLLADDGVVILSGIINSRLDEVKKCYLDNGFKTIKELTLGDWSAMTLGRDGGEAIR
jgi:ribosomal protein L11 methyltransferase